MRGARPFDAVVFDMDGLLLDTERFYLDAFRSALHAMDMAANDDLYLRLVGLNGPSTARVLQAEMGDVQIAFRARWTDEIRVLLRDAIPVKPGVRQLCEDLRARDVPYAIATSTTTKTARTHLDRAGIGDLFSTLVGGDQVASGKPAPDIYLRAADLLGRAPSRCAAFEDSENGVRAALAAGMTTVQVPDLAPPSPTVRGLGQIVAEDLLSGARRLGLLRPDLARDA